MASTFVEAHKDFVLKLKIKAADGSTQIRRVKLPGIAKAGSVSYEELVGLCVTFTFDEQPPTNFKVSLTYFDVDEDPITIASSEELKDAIEQFAHVGVLRITTEVKHKQTTAVPEEKNPEAVDATTNTSYSTTNRATNTTPSPAPQFHNVLESFVGVLATAVSGLQDGLAKAPAATASPAATTRNSNVEAGAGVNTSVPKAKNNSDDSEDKNEETKPEPMTEPASKPEARPFIHGRHTCDSCLITPIVGMRWNAINLPDYDLCGKCHSNYRGKEIQFQPVELDRDRPYQERWNRRHQRINANHARHRRGRGRCRPFGPPPVCPRPPTCPPCPPPPPPPPMAPHHCPPAPVWSHLGPHVRPHMHAGSLDDALKEAIRRSLQDVTAKEAELQDSSKDAKESPADVAVETPAPKEPIAPSQDVVEEEISIPAEPSKEPEITEEEKPAAAPKDSPAVKDEKEEETTTPTSVDDIITDTIEKALEESMDTESVDSAKMVAEEDQKPAAVIKEPYVFELPRKDDSFHDEAIGFGDVAEAMGTTLDIVAGVISEMLSDAERNSEEGNAKDAVKKEEKADTEASEQDDSKQAAVVEESKAGVIIVDSTESDKFEDAWHVVDEHVSPDQEIARAAEMLGSALFHSDIKSSEEDRMSNLSDSFLSGSLPSVVPSIHSHAAPAQLEVWRGHLAQLHELGFSNDDLNVEILERLKAASIGSEEDDDISVSRVVNAILEEK